MSEKPSLPLFEKVRKVIKGLALPVLAIVLWQWAGENGAIAGGALPTPDRVWDAWLKWGFGNPTFGLNPYVGTWRDSVMFSAGRVVHGFVIAIIVGVPLGMLIGWSKLVSSLVDPTIQWLRPAIGTMRMACVPQGQGTLSMTWPSPRVPSVTR